VEPALLIVGMLVGLFIIPFGFPGALVIFASILVFAFLTDFMTIGVPVLVFLGILTLIAETADNWLTALGARRYGATTGSIWLSVVGGVLGAIFIGGPLAVIFGPLGPVVGGFAGAFGIVVANEVYRHGDWRNALRVGWGTFLGRMAGIVLKLVISITMVIAAVWAVVF
jgi:uncharacterized protein YqgC (DUF456 family)